MYQFSTAAVANEQNNANLLSYSSVGCTCDGLKSQCQQEAPGENLFPCLFQLLEAAAHLGSWLLPPPPKLAALPLCGFLL